MANPWGRRNQGPAEPPIELPEIEEVHVSASVLMRIVKHAEAAGARCAGYLLGLDVDQRLEVTETVPLPPKYDDDAEGGRSGHEDKHQREVLENLIQVTPFDNFHCGVYLATAVGTFYVESTVEQLATFAKRDELSKNSIALLYDPYQSSHGALFLRAVRLSARYREIRELERNDYVHPRELLEEVPVRITGGALAAGFVRCLRDSHMHGGQLDGDWRRLHLGAADDPFLVKQLDAIAAGSDELVRQQYDFQRFAKDKSIVRLRQDHLAAIQRFKKENEERVMDGDAPQELTWPALGVAPLPEAPPRLGALLANAQLDHYCRQIEQHVEESYHLLFATSSAPHPAGASGAGQG